MEANPQWSDYNIDLQVNPFGWGPVAATSSITPFDVPYAHYDKKDKFARAAEVNPSQHVPKGRDGRYRRDEASGMNAEFTYNFDAAEDSSFQLVDLSKVRSKTAARKPKMARQPRPGQPRDNRFPAQQQRTTAAGRGGDKRNQKKGGRGPYRRDRRMDKLPSINVESSWDVVAEFDLPQLGKLVANAPRPENIQDLYWCGHLDQYNESYDRLNSRSPQPLRSDRRMVYSVTTREDPVIREKLLVPAAGNVYATDAIIAHLMTMSRSNFSWDIQVQKARGIIFLDKRDPTAEVVDDDEDKYDKRNYPFDFLPVSENANEPPAITDELERYNYPNALAVEATAINQNFSQQVLLGGEHRRRQPNPNPFFDQGESPQDEPAAVAYRYRSFQLGDDIKLVVRCELHAYTSKGGEDQLHTVFALNEWDSKYAGGVDWRRRFETQNSAVLSTELRNNAFKIAKWTAQSILAGADKMKLGFVSRRAVSDSMNHEILGTQTFKPKDFASQIDLRELNMWGIIKMVVEQIQQQEDGVYVLLKDPNRAQVRLYHIRDEEDGDDARENEEDEHDDEEDEEGEEEESKY